MRNSEIRAKVNGGSLGTPSARAARRSVPDDTARRIVARAQGEWKSKSIRSKKSGG